MIFNHLRPSATPLNLSRDPQHGAIFDSKFEKGRKQKYLKNNRTVDLEQVQSVETNSGITSSIKVQNVKKATHQDVSESKYSPTVSAFNKKSPADDVQTSSFSPKVKLRTEHRKSRFGFRGEDVVVWETGDKGTLHRVTPKTSEVDPFWTYRKLHPIHKNVRFLANASHVKDPPGGRRLTPLERLNRRNISTKEKIDEWKAFDDHLMHRAATKAINWDQDWLENFAGKGMIDLMDLTIVGKGVIPMRVKAFKVKPSMVGTSLQNLKTKIKKELLRMETMQPSEPVSYDRSNLPVELYNLAPYLLDKIPHKFSSNTKSPCWENTEAGFRLFCLPYFYLIGAPKSATTDLWSKLMFHPDVVKTFDKEPQFWTRGNLVRGLMRYCSNFMPLIKAITRNEHTMSSYISGDGTASNFWERRRSQMLYGRQPDGPPYFTADLIRAIQPNARIIVIIREPSSRLYSEYLDLDSFWPLFKSPEDFHVRIENVIDNFNKCLETHHVASCASNYYQPRIQIGMYSVHIREWLKRFPTEQVHIIRTEDWAQDAVSELQEVFKFLSLSEISKETIDQFSQKKRMNERKPRNKRIGGMLPETRELLTSFYQPFNEDLAKLLQNEKYLWKKEET